MFLYSPRVSLERFSRIIQVIGEDSFQKLQKAHITIFGLGAVGAWAAEMLARSGIGRFTLVDFDQIALSVLAGFVSLCFRSNSICNLL